MLGASVTLQNDSILILMNEKKWQMTILNRTYKKIKFGGLERFPHIHLKPENRGVKFSLPCERY